MADILTWHGRISFKSSNLLVKNLIQCYQHEISFSNDILDCKCNWDYIHVLFCDDSIVRFPWQRNLQQGSFKWINYPNSLKWSENFEVKSVTISTVVIKESEMFSHYGLQNIKLDSLIKHPADISLFLISCSDSSLFLVDNSGPITKLCFFGGQNFTESYFISLTLPTDVKIVQISCGKAHTILLSSVGCVYTFGVGTKGELGHGNTDCLKEPKLVEALLGLKIRKICAGGWHSACLTEFGDVYLWGWNVNGQLGFDHSQVSVVTEPTFVQIDENEEIMLKSVACGTKCTSILTDNGEVFVSGEIIRTDTKDEPNTYSKFTKLDIDCHPMKILMNEWSLFLVHD